MRIGLYPLKLLIIILCLHMSACNVAPLTPEARTEQARQLAKRVGWKEHTIQTKTFTLKAYGKSSTTKTDILTLYIEGDGLAWISEEMPSNNPTPTTFIGLKMALNNQQNNLIAYLARPCQYVFGSAWLGCREVYWTNLRFSPAVIHAMNQAVDYLKKYYHAKKLIFVGYSGGGTVATLISTQRHDVIQLITAAAVLDTKAWTQQASLTPLDGSLNPADVWEKLASIPQIHWVGGKDTVVPKEIALAFAKRFPSQRKPEIIIIPTFDHTCCWATNWTPVPHLKF